MENVKEYVEPFASFDEPVEYKGLTIKPILAKDAIRFFDAVSVLQIEKNKFPVVEIIQMSYLEFMCNFMVAYPKYFQDFLWILEHALDMSCESERVIEGFKPNEILLE